MTRSENPDGPSALDVADTVFATLTAGGGPLVLDGPRVHVQLPARPVGLRELRELLARPGLHGPVRHAVWAALSRRQADNAWLVGAVGVALPALRRIAAQLADSSIDMQADLDGEVLTGFLAAFRELPASTPRLGNRLLWAAYRSGLATAFVHSPELPVGTCVPAVTAIPPAPWGAGPRTLLAQAVRTGVLSRSEAELIITVRLRDTPVAALSSPGAVSGEEWALRLAHAEERLVHAILSGRLGPRPAAGR